MPRREDVRAFVSVVESGDYVGAIENFYTEDATMQENMGERRGGRSVLMEHERNVMARFERIVARCIGTPIIEGDRAVIRWVFEFTGKDGKKLSLDELAYQRWEGPKIAEERFYYDPAQMR